METDKKTKPYLGTERRRLVRRVRNEQRDLVRWEPEKSSRRHSHGRRAHDGPRYQV